MATIFRQMAVGERIHARYVYVVERVDAETWRARWLGETDWLARGSAEEMAALVCRAA